MWLRRETRHTPTRIGPDDWELVFGGAEDPEQGAAAREERARLERPLARLTAEERSLITESALQGRPYSALGERSAPEDVFGIRSDLADRNPDRLP